MCYGCPLLRSNLPLDLEGRSEPVKISVDNSAAVQDNRSCTSNEIIDIEASIYVYIGGLHSSKHLYFNGVC